MCIILFFNAELRSEVIIFLNQNEALLLCKKVLFLQLDIKKSELLISYSNKYIFLLYRLLYYLAIKSLAARYYIVSLKLALKIN